MAKTCFFWDDLEDNIIEEYDEAGATIADYTTEPDRFGNVISQHRDGQSSFFHYDALGSTLAVTDESQQITDTRAYAAFGETTESTSITTFPYQYIGQKGYYRDGATGEYVVRQRTYVPRTARWLSADTILSFGSLYGYVSNGPLVLQDPSGNDPFAGIDVSAALEYIRDSIEDRIDSAISSAAADVTQSAKGLVDAASLLTGYSRCFTLEIGLKSKQFTATSGTAPTDLDWRKRWFCAALAAAARLFADVYVAPRISSHFPVSAESGCRAGCKCDQKWVGHPFTFPAVPFPLTSVGFPFGHPARDGWCFVSLTLNVAVTTRGFVASCIKESPDESN